jgi:ATP-binding cassette subfamily F protein 3
MIHFEKISLFQGSKQLITPSSASIYRTQKVGIVGRNGCGKSSLFQLLLNDIDLDMGEVRIEGKPLISHIEQFLGDDSLTPVQCVLAGDKEYCKVEQALEDAEQQDKHELLAELHEKMLHIDGYSAKSRAGSILHGLGFSSEECDRAISTFSGGWQMRIRLAKALMCRSDILMLDEPTNHLDFETLVWLEKYLQNYAGTLLLISHDREFLDRVCTHIVHFDNRQLKNYTGNYSEFERLRAEARQHLQAQIEKQDKQRQHLQSFVDRFRAKATKAKQAQSRLKQLEKMENLSLTLDESAISFQFEQCTSKPANYIRLDEVDLGYGETRIIENINFDLKPGDRVGLIGANGQGKSTLIKCLADELSPFSGEISKVKDINVSYFAQHQVDQLHPENTPVQHLLEQNRRMTDGQARTFLGRFGFSNDQAVAKIAPFSGGEKARLVLALMVSQKPNVILLDEPTNHLDMETRLALNIALQEFDGALVLVSHDRYLLDSLCSELWLVDRGKFGLYKGTTGDYQKQVLKGFDNDIPTDTVSLTKQDKKSEKKRLADIRRQLAPLKKELKKAENTLDSLQKKLKTVEDFLAEADSYLEENAIKLKENLQKQINLKQQVVELEEQWMLLLEDYEIQESLLEKA